MERLTSNKSTSDMNMLELAYNSCYADKNHNAKYRDYELDIDSRELVKNLAKDMCNEDLHDMSDEEFDEYMSEMLSVEIDSQIGLLALFYRNLWVMADLRERLKDYEDLEEQGRLLKLPCKVGDIVYAIRYGEDSDYVVVETKIGEIRQNVNGIFFEPLISRKAYKTEDFGTEVFLTSSEAEAKLKELRGETK